jgi:hypothetical protein
MVHFKPWAADHQHQSSFWVGFWKQGMKMVRYFNFSARATTQQME